MELASKVILVLGEIQRIENDVDNENPHRYPIRKMRQISEKILDDALNNATQICDTARVLKQEIDAMDARNQ